MDRSKHYQEFYAYFRDLKVKKMTVGEIALDLQTMKDYEEKRKKIKMDYLKYREVLRILNKPRRTKQ